MGPRALHLTAVAARRIGPPWVSNSSRAQFQPPMCVAEYGRVSPHPSVRRQHPRLPRAFSTDGAGAAAGRAGRALRNPVLIRRIRGVLERPLRTGTEQGVRERARDQPARGDAPAKNIGLARITRSAAGAATRSFAGRGATGSSPELSSTMPDETDRASGGRYARPDNSLRWHDVEFRPRRVAPTARPSTIEIRRDLEHVGFRLSRAPRARLCAGSAATAFHTRFEPREIAFQRPPHRNSKQRAEDALGEPGRLHVEIHRQRRGSTDFGEPAAQLALPPAGEPQRPALRWLESNDLLAEFHPPPHELVDRANPRAPSDRTVRQILTGHGNPDPLRDPVQICHVPEHIFDRPLDNLGHRELHNRTAQTLVSARLDYSFGSESNRSGSSGVRRRRSNGSPDGQLPASSRSVAGASAPSAPQPKSSPALWRRAS